MRVQDAEQLRAGLLKVVVDNALVVLSGHLQLTGGVGEPELEALLVLGAATAKSLLEHLHRGRLDEDEHGVRIDLANVEGALHVNLENDGTAGREVAVNL